MLEQTVELLRHSSFINRRKAPAVEAFFCIRQGLDQCRTAVLLGTSEMRTAKPTLDHAMHPRDRSQ